LGKGVRIECQDPNDVELSVRSIVERYNVMFDDYEEGVLISREVEGELSLDELIAVRLEGCSKGCFLDASVISCLLGLAANVDHGFLVRF
jgi:hypothetical protein